MDSEFARPLRPLTNRRRQLTGSHDILILEESECFQNIFFTTALRRCQHTSLLPNGPADTCHPRLTLRRIQRANRLADQAFVPTSNGDHGSTAPEPKTLTYREYM